MHTCFYHALASCRMGLLGAAIAFSTPAYAEGITVKTTPFATADAKKVPEVTFLGMDGKKSSVKKQPGKIKVLHFWATWCVPCLVELPALSKIQEAYKDKGLNIIAISMDGAKNTARVENYIKQKELKGLNIFMDDNTAAFRAIKASGMPTTVFINSEGKEISRISGVLDWEGLELKEFLDKELAAKK